MAPFSFHGMVAFRLAIFFLPWPLEIPYYQFKSISLKFISKAQVNSYLCAEFLKFLEIKFYKARHAGFQFDFEASLNGNDYDLNMKK